MSKKLTKIIQCKIALEGTWYTDRFYISRELPLMASYAK